MSRGIDGTAEGGVMGNGKVVIEEVQVNVKEEVEVKDDRVMTMMVEVKGNGEE